MMTEKSFLYPRTWMFRFLFRRMFAKLKSIPRYKKWILCFGILISAFCLLLFRLRGPPEHVTAHLADLTSEFSRVVKTPENERTEFFISTNKVTPADKIGEISLIQERFKYVINEKDVCSGHRHFGDEEEKSPFLLVFISSAPNHLDRRFAIRQTWANPHYTTKIRVAVLFLLGIPLDGRQQFALEKESETFRDMIQGNFVDSYNNLTIKSIMGLNWAQKYCSSVDYVMKTDDDVFVNMKLLVEFLHIYGQRRWIGGCIKQMKSPQPFDRQGIQVPMVIGHPPFVAGAGYVISGDIVSELYEASTKRAIIPVEDAFITAYCAQMIGVSPTHYEGFNCGEPVMDDCQMKIKFVGHHVTSDRQRQIWKIVHEYFEDVCKMLRS